MWRKLTVVTLMLGLLALLVLPLEAKPPKGGGPKDPPPSGPGLIAVNDGGLGITVMNPDGTGRTPVAVFNVFSLPKPGWSHAFSDGTVKLAWGERWGTMWVVDVFPEIGVPAALIGVDAMSVDWAPSVVDEDGTESVRICFGQTSTHPDGERRNDIVIANLIYDPLSGTFTVVSAAERVFKASSGVGYFHPRFSPDGTWLVFDYEEVLPNGFRTNSIWVARSDGSELPAVLIDGPGTRDWMAAWSPDGSQLAFVSDCDIYIASLGPDMSVQSIQLVGNTKRKGKPIVVTERNVSWSPDGQQICYSHGNGAAMDYSTGKVMLDSAERFELGKGYWPDWSPMDLPPLP